MAEGAAEARLRPDHEIAHGKWLAAQETEKIWGWETPAGRLRARRRAQLISDGGQLAPGSHVLEIGCGTGLFTEMFAATGARITAVEISPELLEKARRRNLAPDRVRFLERRFEDCDVEGPFDAVIGSSVLHHLEVEIALEKIFSLLRPGGWLSFAEPNLLNPQVFLERRFHFLPIFAYTSPDETAFIRWRLAAQLRRIGFTEVAITPFDWLHPATPEPLIAAVRALGRVVEHVPFAREFSGSVYIRGRRPMA